MSHRPNPNRNLNRSTITVDQILTGIGRVQMADGLGLEAAGVAFDPHSGIRADNFPRTSNPRIYVKQARERGIRVKTFTVPTQAWAIRHAANAYTRTRLTPWLAAVALVGQPVTSIHSNTMRQTVNATGAARERPKNRLGKPFLSTQLFTEITTEQGLAAN